MSGDGIDPQRTCVGCRRRTSASALVRVTDGAHGVGVDGPSDGRGAWVCRDGVGLAVEECVDRALRRGGFARAWRRDPKRVDHDALRRAIYGER